MLWHKLPSSIYFRRGCLPLALEEIATDGAKRAFIVTDSYLFNNGYVDEVVNVLKTFNVETEVFFEVEADPTLSIVRKGAALMHTFKPDVIIALGGGSPMDAAKIMWVMYEHILKPILKSLLYVLWIFVNVFINSLKWVPSPQHQVQAQKSRHLLLLLMMLPAKNIL